MCKVFSQTAWHQSAFSVSFFVDIAVALAAAGTAAAAAAAAPVPTHPPDEFAISTRFFPPILFFLHAPTFSCHARKTRYQVVAILLRHFLMKADGLGGYRWWWPSGATCEVSAHVCGWMTFVHVFLVPQVFCCVLEGGGDRVVNRE